MAPDHNKLNEELETEQVVLGGLLLHNDLIDVTADIIRSDHFGEGLHQRIYQTISALVRLGKAASPRTVKQYLKSDPNLAQIDSKYLESIALMWLPGMDIAILARQMRENAVRRALQAAGRELAEAAQHPIADMPTEQLVEAVEERLHTIMSTEQAVAGIELIEHIADRAIANTEKVFQSPGLTGIMTGFKPADNVMGKWVAGDLIVLAGNTSMGKTALGQQFTWEVAQQGKRCQVFSLEMTAEEYTNRHIAQISGVSTVQMESGAMTSTEMEKVVLAGQTFRNLPIWIDGSPNLTVAQIRARARRLRRRGGIDFMMIDHLRFIRPADTREQEKDQLQQITRDLKSLAKELKIPILLIAHVNREANKRENKKPLMSDLYGSSSIEQNADLVVMIHREEYWLQREKPPSHDLDAVDAWYAQLRPVQGRADIIVAKRRRGPIGEVQVGFNAALTKFFDLSQDTGQQSLGV